MLWTTVRARIPAFLRQAEPLPEPEEPAFGEVESCRECGCTELRACPGGCWWVGRGLCSRCVPLYGGSD